MNRRISFGPDEETCENRTLEGAGGDASSGYVERGRRFRGRRTMAAGGAVAVVAATLSLLGSAAPASATFTWAANSWGECNTARPSGFSPVYFAGVSKPAGRPNNYYYATCTYWGWNGRFYVFQARPVNWGRACALDAYSWSYATVRPDFTVYCVGP
jgi:hypothetical protein